jgi:Bacterial archaeo-eukaryotic release factor family 11
MRVRRRAWSTVILHTDIPTRAQVDRLLVSRDPASVSIYLPTDPASANHGPRTGLRGIGENALQQLRAASAESAQVAAIEEELADLIDDDAFWRQQARTLAVLLTPDLVLTFRLPNRLLSILEVSDRFYLKPLLRAVTFPQVAFVLALAQNSVRVIEVSADDEPGEVRLPDLPSDAASAAGRSSLSDRAPTRRIQGAEGQKVRLRRYARQIDQALRPFLNGLDVPLILASAQPLDSIFRSVNSYPHLAAHSISGNPETTADAELAASAREVLDDLYAAQLRRTHELFERRSAQGRALRDIGDVARAATWGAVDTVLVDIDRVVPGSVDEQSGAVSFAPDQAADRYGVIDEIARRAWLAGGTVLAVRRDDVPGGGAVAAILRYPI